MKVHVYHVPLNLIPTGRLPARWLAHAPRLYDNYNSLEPTSVDGCKAVSSAGCHARQEILPSVIGNTQRAEKYRCPILCC